VGEAIAQGAIAIEGAFLVVQALNALGGGRGPVGHARRSCRKRGREEVKRKKAATLAGCRLETVVPA
jgi:hypothetical protein